MLAFDADAAGQGAAERFYEWESKYSVSVSVAHFPAGKDPGELSLTDPTALREAIDNAQPFLGFRLQRVLDASSIRTPEDRAKTAEKAVGVINEHPDINVRKIYAGQVASHTGLPVADVVKRVESRTRKVSFTPVDQQRSARENAEFVAVATLLHEWDTIAPWLVEGLFPTETMRRAFLALAESNGNLDNALSLADPEAREVLERAAVADIEADGRREAMNLLSAAVRRELAGHRGVTDPEMLLSDRDARLQLELLEDRHASENAAAFLLEWVSERAVNHVTE